jgi:heme exporter protein CcmD
MEHAWNYVGAGYGITTVVLVTYITWMMRRTRRLRRTLADESDV